MKKLALASIAVLVAVGMAAPAAQADPASDLAVARGLWAARDSKDYSYRVAYSCFCQRMPTATIRVVNGKPRKTPVELRRFDTVPELFAEVERALKTAVSVHVRYAPNTGVPIKLDVDQVARVADDEWFLTVSKIRVPRKH